MRPVPRVQLKSYLESEIRPVTTNIPNNGAYKAKIFTPAFRRPAVEEGLEGDLRLGIKAVVAKQAMIR